MASRSLNDLHPDFHPKVVAWINEAQATVGPLLVYCTHRDIVEQATIYAEGRTQGEVDAGARTLFDTGYPWLAAAFEGIACKPPYGRRYWKTRALPGQSFHHSFRVDGKAGALALDFVPMLSGKPLWNAKELYERHGAVAEKHGLTWSGRWKTFKEVAHIQYDKGGLWKVRDLMESQKAHGGPK